MPLNFGGRKRSGAFDTVWPSAKATGQASTPSAGWQCVQGGSRSRSRSRGRRQPARSLAAAARQQASLQPQCWGREAKSAMWPCGLMDKALVLGTKDCRFESCQGQACEDRIARPCWRAAVCGRRQPPAAGSPHASGHTEDVKWPRGVTVSTLDSESSDRGSNPREAYASGGDSAPSLRAARWPPAPPDAQPQNPL